MEELGGLSGGALAALLLAAGGAVATAILSASQDNDFNLGGTAVVISPTRVNQISYFDFLTNQDSLYL